MRFLALVFHTGFYSSRVVSLIMKKNEDEDIEEIFRRLPKEGYSNKASEAIYNWYHR